MLKSSILVAGAVALAIATVSPAQAAYTCGVSADGKSVIVKVSNPDDFTKSCMINCHFKIPHGSASVGCMKTVPANAKDFVLCEKPTGGDKYTFADGNEDCRKQ